MANRMFALVATPSARPPRGATLLRSANLIAADLVPNPSPGVVQDSWETGLRYIPLACGDDGIAQAIGLCGTGFPGFPDPTLRPDEVEYVAPYVAVAQACSAISGEDELDRTIERARLLLEGCETVGIAHELWTGTVAKSMTPDLPNAYLAQDGVVEVLNSGSSTASIDAFAWLEASLGTCACAGVGMIHADPYTATVWQSLHLVERQADGRLLSALGTIVVADPGYDGSAPDGTRDATHATAWAYGTTMVDVRRGPVETLGDRRTINRANNDFDVYAFRPFAATFDPCCHVGIKVNNASRS
jgi:hypothetical protein